MRIIRRVLGFGSFVGALLVLGACGSNAREVKITSTPQGATIYVNGVERGQTPAPKVKIDFPDPESRVFVQARLKGQVRGIAVWTIDEVPAEKEFILRTTE
jgi:hypothetical protein